MKIRAIAIVALALASCPSARAASRRPVRLLPVVGVDSPSLTLANLLPPSAPQQLQLRARLVALGAAPLPGVSRRLSRAEIEGRLGTAMAQRLEIPSHVVVERQTLELSRRDVFRAIREALVKNGFPGAGSLRPADVQIQMPLKCTRPHPGIRVVGASFDPELQMAVFRLQTANEAGVGPFDAMVRPVAGLKTWLEPADAKASEARTASFLTRAPQDPAWRVRKARGKPIVMPLQTVNLVFIAGNMEIHTRAETLDPGYLDQVIRVRMNKTRQIFRAKVVAPDYLEARF